MSSLMRTVFVAAGMIALQAQTPAAQAPLRHLEYRVAASSTATAQSASYSGTDTAMATGGFDGTISVDVVALAKDGGMVVRATVQRNHEVRADQPVTCAVYGSGNVVCPEGAPNSGVVNVLFGTLGRGFYDPSEVSEDGTWNRGVDNDDLSLHNHFSRKATDNADVVLIREHTELVPHKQIAVGFTSDTDIRYNVALSVPVSIHDYTTYVGHGATGGTERVDLTLTKDSFAH